MAEEVDRFREGANLASLLGDWTSRPGPLYRRLADAMAGATEDGALRPGERLPSERELARSLAVSRATVVAAYDELRARDLLDRRQGSGTRVNGKAKSFRGDGRVRGGKAATIFQRLIDGPGPPISLTCAAESGVPEVAEALESVTRHDIAGLLDDHGYHPRGLPVLREVIARRYTELGLPTEPDQVLVTTGAHQALVVIAEVYLRAPATVAVEAPSWPPCLDIFRSMGAELVPVPLDEEGIDPNRLAAVFAEHRPTLLSVMPTYHNPAGILMSARRRRRVAELAAEYGVAVLEDNAYAEQGLDPSAVPPPPLGAFGPAGAETITVESLKALWGGLRVGWVRGPAGIIERCARRKALADLGSPVIEQAVAARLIPRMPEITTRTSVIRRERCAALEGLLRERLPGWSWRVPDGGSSLWVSLPSGDADVFAQLALRHGVEVVPGSTMDPTGAHDAYLRVPFMYDEDVLDELTRRLADAWTELRRHGPREPLPLRPIV